jgi:DNA-binding NarL/FixJ family response regulator
VDDEPVAREGLRLWLAGERDVQVIGETGTPVEAIAMILRERPDLLFLDVQISEGWGSVGGSGRDCQYESDCQRSKTCRPT